MSVDPDHTSEKDKETIRLYYENIFDFLQETLDDKKKELEKYGHFWSFRMRWVIRQELKRIRKQIAEKKKKYEHYKKIGRA